MLQQDGVPTALLLQKRTPIFLRSTIDTLAQRKPLLMFSPGKKISSHLCKLQCGFSVPPHFPLHSSWLWHSPTKARATGSDTGRKHHTLQDNSKQWSSPADPMVPSWDASRKYHGAVHTLQHSLCPRSSQLHFPSLYFGTLRTITCT